MPAQNLSLYNQEMKRTKLGESLKAFIPEFPIEKIITYCNIYPVKDWTEWTDYLGNHIKIYKNKKINHYQVVPEEKIITDIYHRSHPSKILKISHRILIAEGDGFWIGWALGKNDRLRCIYFNDGWRANPSVLSLGLESTIIAINYIDSELEGEIDILSLRGPNSKKIERGWVFNLPFKIEDLDKMKEFPLC